MSWKVLAARVTVVSIWATIAVIWFSDGYYMEACGALIVAFIFYAIDVANDA